MKIEVSGMQNHKLLIFLLFIFMCSGILYAQDVINYGRKLEIDPDGSIWAGKLNDGEKFPIISPDGKTIAFTSLETSGLWIAPASGGDAALVFLFDKEYSWEGRQFFASCDPIAFTPDGREVYYKTCIIDPARGSRVVPLDTGGLSVRGTVPVIKKVNLERKELTTIVEEVIDANLSSDGRYLVYNVSNLSASGFDVEGMLTLLDLATGKRRILVERGFDPCFTPDGKHIIYINSEGPKTIDIWQFYRIPLEGGVPEKISNFPRTGNFFTYPAHPEVSPDGKWILFEAMFEVDLQIHKTGLCVLNLSTRDVFKTFPHAKFAQSRAKWLYDGSGFIYSLSSDRFLPNSKPEGYRGDICIAGFDPAAFRQPTSVVEIPPVKFSLSGNYPNPFNPTTTISFTLPETGQANLSIYSVSGQKVRELVSGILTAGKRSVVWDGRDQHGAAVSGGVYLYRMQSGSHFITSKMLLVK
jgi:hypothetical protein